MIIIQYKLIHLIQINCFLGSFISSSLRNQSLLYHRLFLFAISILSVPHRFSFPKSAYPADRLGAWVNLTYTPLSAPVTSPTQCSLSLGIHTAIRTISQKHSRVVQPIRSFTQYVCHKISALTPRKEIKLAAYRSSFTASPFARQTNVYCWRWMAELKDWQLFRGQVWF